MTGTLSTTVPAARAAPLLFFSGACALIYQVAWLRELRDVFGASTASSAAVLAIFMGGLGTGGLLLGRRIAAAKVPLQTYAHLEIGVGLSACVTPFLVMLARGAYLAMGGQSTMGVAGATIVRLLLAAVVLGVPTVLMGGTLPAAARAATPPGDRMRRAVAILYGTNTIGAVCGALAANFFLLEIFGTHLTLWMAGLINLLVGFFARMISRLPGVKAKATDEKKASQAHHLADMPAWVPPLAAGVSGFVFLLMEIVWYRMLAPLLGGSSYTFGLILAVALAGIGIGGIAYALGRPRPTLALFGVTCALEAACLALPYALGDRIAVLAILLRPLGIIGFAGHVGAWTTVLSIVVLPTAVVAGFQFPLTIALFGARNDHVARHVALAYAMNTLGSIAGSLAGGFGLLPALTAPGCWRLTVWTLVAMGIVASGVGFVRLGDSRRQLLVAWTFALSSIAMLRAVGPTSAWRHSPIGAGRVDPSALATKNGTTSFLHAQRRAIVWEVDGVESTVGLGAPDSYDFIVSGKSDGSALGDAATQVFGGLLGTALRPARTSLVIGLGTGSTAGWLGAVPEMERVDVLEIEPSMHHVADLCAPVNHDVLANPKVHIRWGDAREMLLTSKSTFDLIFSEPSNPYRAGVSSFFTADFYRAVKSRLSKDGIFLQWLQLYEIDGAVVRSVIATLGTAFPHISIWETQPGDVVLVATNEPVVIDVARLREQVKQEPMRSAMRAVWSMDDAEGFVGHHVASETFSQDILKLGIEPNTDDRNILEYSFARNVGKGGNALELEAWSLSRQRQTDRPRTVGMIDWAAVDQRRVLFRDGDGTFAPELRHFQRAVTEWRAGSFAHALTAWRSWGKPAATLYEKRLVAESMAEAGDGEEVKVAIDALAAETPGEAHFMRARWLARTGNKDQARDEIEAAYREYRSNPWLNRIVASRALNVLATLAKDPNVNERMSAVIAEPFAVRSLERLRRGALVDLVPTSDPRCVDAIRDLEPFVPWNEEFLRRRQECYEIHSAPLVVNAQRDLRRFLEDAPNKL